MTKDPDPRREDAPPRPFWKDLFQGFQGTFMDMALLVIVAVVIALATGVFSARGAERVSAQEAADLARRALAESGYFHAGEPVAPNRPLPSCEGGVLAAPDLPARMTVTLSCSAPAWSRVLRLRGAAPYAGRAPQTRSAPPPASAAPTMALALAHPLPKGATITAKDLVFLPVTQAMPEQFYTRPEDISGQVLRRSLGSGRIILARHLTQVWSVRKERPVVVAVDNAGISVSLRGIAEADAKLGDFVSVTSLSSGRTIMGRVIAPDIVRVALKPINKQP